MIIQWENDGQELVSTNFWETEAGKKHFAISPNAGCLRLLLPESYQHALPDMAACEYVIMSRLRTISPIGVAYELLFEDHSDEPYSMHTSAHACLGMHPLADHKPVKRVFSVWIEGPRKVFEKPLYCRYVPRLPWLKPLHE